jgi:hypothetical protein
MVINVPYIDANMHHLASAMVMGPGREYADIRDWFPSGLRR